MIFNAFTHLNDVDNNLSKNGVKRDFLHKVWYNLSRKVDYMNEFIMTKPEMTLAQFLKATDYISSGGQAKYFLMEYVVTINNITEDRRGKKIYPGDVVIVVDDKYQLIYDQEA